MSDRLVFPADASFSDYGRRTRTRYHWPSANDRGLSACGRCWLNDSAGCSPEQVVPTLRCGLPACKRQWQEFAARPTGEPEGERDA